MSGAWANVNDYDELELGKEMLRTWTKLFFFAMPRRKCYAPTGAIEVPCKNTGTPNLDYMANYV